LEIYFPRQSVTVNQVSEKEIIEKRVYKKLEILCWGTYKIRMKFMAKILL